MPKTTTNLCDSCTHDFETCPASKMFGGISGKGSVVHCCHFAPDETKILNEAAASMADKIKQDQGNKRLEKHYAENQRLIIDGIQQVSGLVQAIQDKHPKRNLSKAIIKGAAAVLGVD